MTTFGALFVPQPLRDAVSDAAWLEAMLEAERALARVNGLDVEIGSDYDIDALCEQGRAAGNPVEPLVRAIRERTSEERIHFGATSQDILDSAAMLVARSALGLIDDELEGAAAAAARLAQEHRDTPMAARTLLQQAVPTTFGLKAANWLVLLLDARDRLGRLTLPAQLGGAAGTLSAFGDKGTDVLARFAEELGLADPGLPWHVNRGPVAALGGALGGAAAACAKIGLDIVLLAQTEVSEVSEAGEGPSSTMAHKRNPTRAVLARACARGVRAQVAVLAAGEHEHERAAGAWHAEWNALSEALALTGGAAAASRESLDGLRVDAERMRANMSDDLHPDRIELGSAGAFVDRALERWRA